MLGACLDRDLLYSTYKAKQPALPQLFINFKNTFLQTLGLQTIENPYARESQLNYNITEIVDYIKKQRKRDSTNLTG